MYLTQQSLDKIKEEVTNLKGRRKEIAERIRLARELGDLSENSEYDDARNEQSFTEGRIEELQDMIAKAKVVAKGQNSSKAEIGSVVILEMYGEKITYELVDATESDPAAGKISVESPIGHSLLDKEKGEKVEINLPAGKIECKILDIK